MAKKRKSPAAKLPDDMKQALDPYNFGGGTRAVTLNLPVALWDILDQIAPSRGKNKFFINLLTRYLTEHGMWPPATKPER